MQKIRPFLWFDGKAEEAALFYIGIFKNATLGSVMRYGDAGPGPKGSVMLVTFTIEEQEFIALNGSSRFSFTPAISFFVTCENQEEVDTYWDRLCDGGNPLQCGWITDKYGVTWQIVPSGLTDMLQDEKPAKATAVMQAMMQMVKLDIRQLRQAYEQA
jgi:predicted 3-demethylubiquinone-9 3-methyltransferase (glyoxalase superfamily)